MPFVQLNASPPNVKPHISDIYLATLVVKRDGADYINLSTPLPENFDFSLSSSYDRPLDQPLSNLSNNNSGIMSPTGKIATTMILGQTTKHKYLSGAVWVGGSYLGISLPFVIHAYEDSKVDVIDKVVQLMSLVTPSESGPGGLLQTPGPTVGNLGAMMAGDFSEASQMSGDEITINLGKFFTLSPCIITSVQPTFDTQFDQKGTPIATTVNVTIESFFTTTKEDLIKAFKSSLSKGTI